MLTNGLFAMPDLAKSGGGHPSSTVPGITKMFATNLDGVFHVFQAAARHMTERRGRRQVRPAGRDLEPRLAVRHRAQ